MEFFCFDFINKQWDKNSPPCKQLLEAREWTGEFLKKWNIDLDFSLTENEYSQLVKLREKLAEAIEEVISQKKISPQKLMELNDFLAAISLKYSIEYNCDQVLQLQPINKDFDFIIFKVMSSFVEVLTKYDIDRIRKCQNPDCWWIFYDQSKNNSRKWCCNKCSSLIKVRKYREKHKL